MGQVPSHPGLSLRPEFLEEESGVFSFITSSWDPTLAAMATTMTPFHCPYNPHLQLLALQKLWSQRKWKLREDLGISPPLHCPRTDGAFLRWQGRGTISFSPTPVPLVLPAASTHVPMMSKCDGCGERLLGSEVGKERFLGWPCHQRNKCIWGENGALGSWPSSERWGNLI